MKCRSSPISKLRNPLRKAPKGKQRGVMRDDIGQLLASEEMPYQSHHGDQDDHPGAPARASTNLSGGCEKVEDGSVPAKIEKVLAGAEVAGASSLCAADSSEAVLDGDSLS
jgi:hypothetical protein